MGYGDIRNGLVERLETIDSLAAVYVAVPDRVVTPSAALLPGDPFVEYHVSSGAALTLYRFDVIIFAGRWETSAGQETIDALVADLPDVLESDPTLGGSSEVVYVRDGTSYGVITVADSTHTGCRFSVEVHAR